MSQKKSLQVDNFLTKLGHLGLKIIVLCLVDIDLVLQISEPLLLPLATFQSGNTALELA